MKIKNLLITSIAVIYMGVNSQAQSDSDRKINKKSVKTSELRKLEKEFQDQFNKSEEKVQIYLKNHPSIARSFIKEGSVYYLKTINADGQPVYINSKNRESATLIKADQLYDGGSVGTSITGTGMVAGIWDTGEVRSSHELLAGKVTMQAGQTVTGFEENYKGADHMTHVSGTMVGKDIAGKPRGIAYGATSLNYDPKNDAAEMTAFAAQGYLISNHSYGMSNDTSVGVWAFGAYNDDSKDWDQITKNAPFYLPFVAGGNEQTNSGNMSKLGYDIMTGTSAAKNVMTVGALDANKSMSDYSNWGPTDDGRVKPEIVARGTGINSSTYADPTTNQPSDNSYSGDGSGSSGTSYSSPAAAASGLLLQQYYRSLNPTYMKASTLKALMLATAEDLGQIGPDYKFGWGLLNVEAAANAIKNKSSAGNPSSILVTDVSSKGCYIEEISYNPTANSTDEMIRYVYAAGTQPLIISIAWTDDEGIEQLSSDGIDPTTSRLVYDFDMLAIETSTGVNFRPWKPSSMANRTVDAAFQTTWFDGNGNNYKQIKITSPVAGALYSIHIRKKTGSPALARMVSLIVTGTLSTTATNQSFCQGSTVANLFATGTGIQWYLTSTGGTALASTTNLTANTDYYASKIVNALETTDREKVSVAFKAQTSIELLPSVISVCSGLSTSLTATASGVNLNYAWSNLTNGATATISTSGTYFVTVTGSCGTAVSNSVVLNESNCVPNTITGVSQNTTNNNQLIIYPNPNNGSFVIEIGMFANYTVSSVDGKVLTTGKLNIGKTIVETNLCKGVYLVNVGGTVKKLIIE